MARTWFGFGLVITASMTESLLDAAGNSNQAPNPYERSQVSDWKFVFGYMAGGGGGRVKYPPEEGVWGNRGSPIVDQSDLCGRFRFGGLG